MSEVPEADKGQIERLLNLVVDPVWYRARHRDVTVSGKEPLYHFIESGLRERRDPNRWFDGGWYARQYPDVAASGALPLLHYMAEGAARARDPHPRFDAAWYVEQHPEAAANPMLFHLRVGAARGWLTERPVTIEDYLPSTAPPFTDPDQVSVDVIIPVYRGLEITRRCVDSVLRDTDRPAGKIIIIDDRSPEPKLSSWLDRLAKTGAITLLRNKKNLGFVASVNRGMRHADDHDVALLNSDTEVPPGWLRRLRAQAYAAPKVASVSPLSNNATICSYLGYEGGPMPRGMTLAGIDSACRTINAGRFATTPTTVGFCMYIRRAALEEVGLFDAKTFGKGYGEENDFCLRASALGWSHHIACDTFVLHEGGASFGASAGEGIARAYAILTDRYPHYALNVARHVDDSENAPFRFAVTMALFRASGLPAVLTISHDLDGGVRRHVQDVIARDLGRANHLVLEPATRGLSVSVPALPGHPKLVLAAERWRDVAAVARSAGVTRVHVHHLMGLDLDVRALIHELGVGFDVTVHDYFSICPQVTLLPWSAGSYCGEPAPAGCDACIANRPSHGATDILSWRLRWAWQFNEAEHVLVPSLDALTRLRRYAPGANLVLVPHDEVRPGPWPTRTPPRPAKRLRVAVLGVLANHKGAQLVASVAMAASPDTLEIQLIGALDAPFPDRARELMTVSGPYQEGELPALLAKFRPHVIWFPAPWPETYSFTLSAAIESGLPIVASDIGAFPERLAGRPMTWLLPPNLDSAPWLSLFGIVSAALRGPRSLTRDVAPRSEVRHLEIRRPEPPRPVMRHDDVDVVPRTTALRHGSAGLVNLRRESGTSVVAIPETFDDGSYTPCAYIRLLLPLTHPHTGNRLTVTLAGARDALRYRADIIVTQRHAVPSVAAADALAAHAKRTGARLIYDLDDDLLTVPPTHPEAADLTALATAVERMIRLADRVHVSTAPLADRLAKMARQVRTVPNALDERLWVCPGRDRDDPYGPVRILCMGTSTHDADFSLILPALTSIHRQFGDQVRFDLIGFVYRSSPPAWIRQLAPSPHAGRSYPGFVNWLTATGPWDIGLAPLTSSQFNASKSAIKVLDYAALGLATLASDVPAYRGSLADGPGGRLVPNTEASWYEAVSWLIRDAASRRRLAQGGTRLFQSKGTLSAQVGMWCRTWPRPQTRKAPPG